MKLIVNPHKIEIDKSPVNEREINISKCEFEFADEITNEYVKEAYFTFKGTTYKQIIMNNECDFPSEVLVEKGTVEIGVVAYLVENETELKRYNPSPAYFDTWRGSLKDNYENSEPITPTDKEQIESAIAGLQSDVADLEVNKQDTLVSGENIKTINSESLLGEGNIDLNDTYYTENEINDLLSVKADKSEIPTKTSDLDNDSGYITNEVNDLINYTLATQTGSQIALNINSSNYQMTAILKDKNGNIIYTSNTIDLPIESMIVNIAYDSATKEIVFTLQNGNVLRVSVADLVSGLVSTDELNTILANYYTKTEIDNLLSQKANSSDVYTKSQTDDLLSNKADSSNVYSKSETDNLLSNKIDTTTFNESQSVQDTNINWLQTLVNQMPTVEATGTDISLQDVLNYRFMKFVMKGNSSQFSTTGKNLLNPKTTSTTKNGVTLTYDSTTQEITLNGTCDTNNTTFNLTGQSITIPANTTIYSRLKYISGSSTGKLYLQIFNSGYSRSAGVSTDSGLSADITSSASYSSETTFSVNRIRVDEESSFTNLKFKVYLSTVDNEYELFTGGIPAPNPSYPYPVNNVTGENSLVISNMNLFSSTWQQGTINSTTGENQSSSNEIRTKEYILISPNQHYAIKRNLTTGAIKMRCYDISKNYLGSGTNYVNLIEGNTSTNPMGIGDNSCVISFKDEVRYFRITDGLNNLATQYSMIKGDTPLSDYVPHEEQIKTLSLGNIELCSTPDGTIEDEIIGTPNNWVKRAYIGKKILDGSETWTTVTSVTDYYSARVDIENMLPTNTYTKENSGIFSDKFSAEVYANISPALMEGIARYSGANDANNRLYLSILKSRLTNVSTWANALKTWLGTNNVPLYYPLAEYVDTPITDTTLINQLNNFYNNSHSYNGTTNITTTYADGNEQMILDFEALKNIWADLETRVEILESEV